MDIAETQFKDEKWLRFCCDKVQYYVFANTGTNFEPQQERRNLDHWTSQFAFNCHKVQTQHKSASASNNGRNVASGAKQPLM
jgi:hypothetical protein